jgi:dTDP-L-rhamnose 4-epimerase
MNLSKSSSPVDALDASSASAYARPGCRIIILTLIVCAHRPPDRALLPARSCAASARPGIRAEDRIASRCKQREKAHFFYKENHGGHGTERFREALTRALLQGIRFVSSRILITGGAGFIGAHLARELLTAGYSVRVLDALDEQVHPDGTRPSYLDRDVELMIGDVADRDAVRRALAGVDMVCHLAANVGVGQSMYEIVRYTRTNELGTAVLLEELIGHDIKRLLVASSMSIYGEGLARLGNQFVEPASRSLEQLKSGRWELLAPSGDVLEPVATPETKSPALHSVYALNKYVQERMALIFGAAYSREVVAMRFFNVYGPYQALSNPYTGVLAIFGSRLLNGRPPMIFEDGLQRRDFVHVSDVARACRLALESPLARGRVFNVGSGESRTVLDIAETMARVMGRQSITPHVTGKYRAGDIRHCFADIGLARDLLGFSASTRFEDGLAELVGWLLEQNAVDSVEQATQELSRRGLVA